MTDESIGERLAAFGIAPTAKGRAVIAYDARLQDSDIPPELRSGLTIAFMDGWDAAKEDDDD